MDSLTDHEDDEIMQTEAIDEGMQGLYGDNYVMNPHGSEVFHLAK